MIKDLINSDKKLVVRFVVSLLLCIALTATFFGVTALAETVEADAAGTAESGLQAGDYLDTDPSYVDDDVGSSVLQELVGVDASQPLEVILLVTLLALAPSLLIMMTCFTRIIIVLSFLRSAMQTQTTPPNMVLIGMSLLLTFFIMAPVFGEINEVAYQPYVNDELTTQEALEAATVPIKSFMLKQTSNDDLDFFIELGHIEEPEGGFTEEYIQNDLSLTVVMPAFMISELKRAFQIGFLLFIPFLVIDLVVGCTLMSMGMMMLPPAMISMPFKILVFVLADGWNLLIGSIVSSYNW